MELEVEVSKDEEGSMELGEMVTNGCDRGSSSSCIDWRRLRFSVGGALRDGRRRIVDSICPSLA